MKTPRYIPRPRARAIHRPKGYDYERNGNPEIKTSPTNKAYANSPLWCPKCGKGKNTCKCNSANAENPTTN